jgi:protein TonB
LVARSPALGDVLDLTDGFVMGAASGVSGGATASQGGSAPAGTGRPRSESQPPSHAFAAPAATTPDRSRKPALAGGFEWSCPFPSDADAAGIDAAVVTLRLAVDAAGGVRSVAVESDPGHGFGDAARRCAQTKRWTPALDREGDRVDGGVVIRVRFER